MATKLERLLIKEVSGVDDPANEVPGWMVTKAADTSAPDATQTEDASSIVGKIKQLLTGKEEIEMTKDELNAVLDERFAKNSEDLVEKLAERLSKSVEAPVAETGLETPAPEAAAEPAPADAVVALTEEQVTKAIEDGLQPLLEIVDKVLDRLAAVEEHATTRKSIDGQETPVEKSDKPTLGDGFLAALKGHSVVLS